MPRRAGGKAACRWTRQVEDQRKTEVYAQQDLRPAHVDETLPDYDERDYETDILDEQLEAAIRARKANKTPELDTISYMSARVGGI